MSKEFDASDLAADLIETQSTVSSALSAHQDGSSEATTYLLSTVTKTAEDRRSFLSHAEALKGKERLSGEPRMVRPAMAAYLAVRIIPDIAEEILPWCYASDTATVLRPHTRSDLERIADRFSIVTQEMESSVIGAKPPHIVWKAFWERATPVESDVFEVNFDREFARVLQMYQLMTYGMPESGDPLQPAVKVLGTIVNQFDVGFMHTRDPSSVPVFVAHSSVGYMRFLLDVAHDALPQPLIHAATLLTNCVEQQYKAPRTESEWYRRALNVVHQNTGHLLTDLARQHMTHFGIVKPKTY